MVDILGLGGPLSSLLIVVSLTGVLWFVAHPIMKKLGMTHKGKVSGEAKELLKSAFKGASLPFVGGWKAAKWAGKGLKHAAKKIRKSKDVDEDVKVAEYENTRAQEMFHEREQKSGVVAGAESKIATEIGELIRTEEKGRKQEAHIVGRVEALARELGTAQDPAQSLVLLKQFVEALSEFWQEELSREKNVLGQTEKSLVQVERTEKIIAEAVEDSESLLHYARLILKKLSANFHKEMSDIKATLKQKERELKKATEGNIAK